MIQSPTTFQDLQSYQDDEKSEGCLKLFVGGLNYLSMQADLR